MIVGEKTKTIYNKIDHSKAQNNLDRKVAKILAIALQNAGKYEFLTDEDILSEKILI